MAYALKTADAKFLMTTPASMEVAAGAARKAGLSQVNLLLLEGKLNGYSTVHDLIAIGKSYGEHRQTPAFKLPPGKKNKDICGFLSFSSGTTGLPKAVCPLNQLPNPFRFVLRNVATGHDISPKRHCSMPPNTTMYTAKHNACASCAPTISHNRSRPPTAPTDPPQCRSPHDPFLHNAYHALRNPRIQAQRTPPRTTHPHPPDPRSSRQRLRL